MNINATIIGQMIAFLVFVWFCMKYVWPPIMQTLTDRERKIAEGLAAARHAQESLEQAHQQIKKEINEARGQAQLIVEQAEQRAGQIVEQAKESARQEGERLITAARAQIDQEINRAREELRRQVVSIAVAGAGKILGEKLDEAANSKLIDKLADEL